MPIIDDSYISALRLGLQEKENLSSAASQDQELITTTEDAFKRILNLCTVKDRAVSSIRKRLLDESFSEHEIEQAIERAQTCGLLDDKRFAEAFVRTRMAAGKGKQGIEAELSSLNIDPFEVQGWSEEFFPSEAEEAKRAITLLEKKPPTSKNKRDGAYRRLIGKGYSSSVASTAARLWFESLK